MSDLKKIILALKNEYVVHCWYYDDFDILEPYFDNLTRLYRECEE